MKKPKRVRCRIGLHKWRLVDVSIAPDLPLSVIMAFGFEDIFYPVCSWECEICGAEKVTT